MDLHAHLAPFDPSGGDLHLQLDREAALELHGALLEASGRDVTDRLLAIIETYRAGGSLERFQPEPEYAHGNYPLPDPA